MSAKAVPFAKLLGGAVLLVGSAVITTASLGYFDPEELAPFVIEKLPLPNEALWLFALKAHVAAAAFSLPACVALQSTWALRRFPLGHRWLGRVAGLVVLLALAPSGFYLSLFAKGGLPGTVGFMLSGAIVVVSMVAAVATARSRRFAAHRRFTWHVLAQLSVAVSSRLMLYVLDAVDADPEPAYLVSLWLPVVGSALAVELFHLRLRPLSLPWRNHEAPAVSRGVEPRRAELLAGAR